MPQPGKQQERWLFSLSVVVFYNLCCLSTSAAAAADAAAMCKELSQDSDLCAARPECEFFAPGRVCRDKSFFEPLACYARYSKEECGLQQPQRETMHCVWDEGALQTRAYLHERHLRAGQSTLLQRAARQHHFYPAIACQHEQSAPVIANH